MGFWLRWLGRALALASLFKLGTAVFDLGISSAFKSAIVLYEQNIYPIITPIVSAFKFFGIALNRDMTVLVLASLGIIVHSSTQYIRSEPNNDMITFFSMFLVHGVYIIGAPIIVYYGYDIWLIAIIILCHWIPMVISTFEFDKVAGYIFKEYVLMAASLLILVALNYSLQ